MADQYKPSRRSAQMLAQLDAEMAVRRETIKSLAAKTGKPYNTFRRYVRGERPMPADDLFDSLDVLGVDYSDFVRRAMER